MYLRPIIFLFSVLAAFGLGIVGLKDGHPHLTAYEKNVTNRNIGISKPLLFSRSSPFLLHFGARTCIMCHCYKCASSEFQRLWAHSLAPEIDVLRYSNRGLNGTVSLSQTVKKLSKLNSLREEELQGFYLSEAVPRIIIGRNPYIRLVSAKYSKAKSLAFPELIRKLYNVWRGNGEKFPQKYNKHFTPITSNQCSLSVGFEYDYVLRLEDEHSWFMPLMELLGIVDSAKYGWGPTGTSCFYRPADTSCEEFYDLKGDPEVLLAKKAREVQRQYRMVRNVVEAHYTPELASMVTDMFKEDFIVFQYPLWDGNPPFQGLSFVQ